MVAEQTKALGKKIASQRKELDKTKFAEADKLLAEIEKAADDLAKAPPAQKDKALVELNKLTDALKERQKQLGSPEQVNRATPAAQGDGQHRARPTTSPRTWPRATSRRPPRSSRNSRRSSSRAR